jgi:hypothetical protein
VSIGNLGGGTQQLAHRYTGHPLRTLKALLREHDTVTLDITFRATGPAGVGADVHGTVQVEA